MSKIILNEKIGKEIWKKYKKNTIENFERNKQLEFTFLSFLFKFWKNIILKFFKFIFFNKFFFQITENLKKNILENFERKQTKIKEFRINFFFPKISTIKYFL